MRPIGDSTARRFSILDFGFSIEGSPESKFENRKSKIGRRLKALLPVVGSAAALVLAGCAAEPPLHRQTMEHGTAVGRGTTNADRRVAPVPERDRVLVDYRTAATALRHGDDAVAKEKLDDAIAFIGGIITNSEQAARARGLFTAESTKVFIGEPYERVMAYYYRGILYWRDGQPDNARACFRSGQVIDSDPNNEHYDADYVLLDYLDGLATAKLGGDGSDDFARAKLHAGEKVPLPPYNTSANVLVFAEYGYGPRKYTSGQYGEQLRFYTDDSPSRSARLILDDGRRVVPLPAYDDIGYQAVTRGGRVMDHILGNKAVFKAGADVAGDIALAGAAIAQEKPRPRDRREGRDRRDNDSDGSDFAALGLGVIGILGKVASAATEAQADTRQWDNLPQRLSFAAVKLPAGEHRGRIEFLDREGNILEQRTKDVTISVAADDRDTVVFLSELKS